MTIRTVRTDSVFHELLLMKILVAVRAAVVFDCHAIFVFMTGLAGNGFVTVLQRETCFGMIKVADSSDRMEGSFGMTLGAAGTEISFMRILMAIIAIGEGYPAELLEFFSVYLGDFMAGCTGNRLVHSFQRIPGLYMAEFCGWFESITGMAIGACLGKRSLVVIGMAVQTFPADAEIGEFFRFYRGIFDMLCPVAVSTGF